MNHNHSGLSFSWDDMKLLAQVRTYPQGVVLAGQGRLAREVFLLEQGIVKLVSEDARGRTAIVGLRYRGWLIGSAAVLLDSPYAATVQTLTRCLVRHVSAEQFRRLVREDKQFSSQLHLMHCREIYDYTTRVGNLTNLSARRRLERFLCELASAQKPNDSPKPLRLQLPLKQWELSQLLGISREHLNRTLASLEQEDILRRDKGWLLIPDPRKLLS